MIQEANLQLLHAQKYLLLLILVFINKQQVMVRKYEMMICLGSSCFSRGNREVVQFIKDYLKKNHLDDKVIFRGTRCLGSCSDGPNLLIDGKIINGVTIELAENILEEYLGELK
jgi:NADH:ubiquinone oxidoreductase subunit E